MGGCTFSGTRNPGGMNVRQGLCLALSTLILVSRADAQSSGGRGAGSAAPALVQGYGRLPLSFEINRGQSHSKVKFLNRGPQHAVFLTDEAEAVFTLSSSEQDSQPSPRFRRPIGKPENRRVESVRVRLVGARRPQRVEGLDPLPGKSNYFVGNDPKKWVTNVPTYAKVAYREVYPGVDLVYYGNQRQLEYDFVVKPGADPRNITLEFQGQKKKISVNAEGNLLVEGALGKIVHKKPRSYQVVSGTQRTVRCEFRLKDDRSVSFDVGEYDHRLPLTLDPMIVYSTYLGVGGCSLAQAVAVDAAGCAYVAGYTMAADFPVSGGSNGGAASVQPVYGHGNEAFVSKLSADGSALVYSTYLGGSGSDYATAIAVDFLGNAYVTGYTGSQDFPLNTPLQQTHPAESASAFIAKLSSSGSQLAYSTYFGTTYTFGIGIAVDPSGSTYIVGYTGGSVPIVNPFQQSSGGDIDGFVARLTPAGTALMFCSYLGGTNLDAARAVAIDGQGNAYITGETASSDFPTLGPLQAHKGGAENAFVVKVTCSGNIAYSTYLGGSSYDVGSAIAVDSSNNAYVGGYTESEDFPTKTAYQPLYHGEVDGFLAKVNPQGSGLVYSTFLGGGGHDYVTSLAVAPSGSLYLTGYTHSQDFPCVDQLQGPSFSGPDSNEGGAMR